MCGTALFVMKTTKVSNRTNMDQNKNYVPLTSTIYNNLILSNKK